MAGGAQSRSCLSKDLVKYHFKIDPYAQSTGLGWVERNNNEYRSITSGGTLPRSCLC